MADRGSLTLAIETSSSQGAVGLFSGKKCHAEITWQHPQAHSDRLVSAIDECLKLASVESSQLTSIAVDVGPGSFTGIRVGVNAARAIAYCLNKKIFTTTSLEILAAGAREYKLPVLSMINAHRNLVYTMAMDFRHGKRVLFGPGARTLEELEVLLTDPPYIPVGDGYATFVEFMSSGLKSKLVYNEKVPVFPRTIDLALLSDQDQVQNLSWREVIPLYLRRSSAEEKLEDSMHG